MKECSKHEWQETYNYFICKICGKHIRKDDIKLMKRMPKTMFENLGFNQRVG